MKAFLYIVGFVVTGTVHFACCVGRQPGAPASEIVPSAPTTQVRAILQAKNGDMWFGTHGAGICRFDGRAFAYFTEKDGLPSDLVRTMQEDKQGNLWITTNDGLCVFDGKSFKRVSVPVDEAAPLPRPTAEMMWFCAQGGAYYLDGGRVGFLPLPLDEADRGFVRDQPGLNPYAVYSICVGRDGSVWFGTESRGVCRYAGGSFTWLRGQDLDKAAVRAVFEDSKGDMWFGNSGVGLFRYHHKMLTNFGVEQKVENLTWLKSRFAKIPGKIADPQCIIEDKAGDLWVGVYDSGAWRWDGTRMRNFTTSDGLTVDSVSVIYEARNGELWIGTSNGVCTFDGQRFVPLTLTVPSGSGR